MIPVVDQAAADSILERARSSMRDYRYDMLRFRLALCLQSPTAWKMFADRYPNTNVTVMVRKGKADDDANSSMYDVIERCDDIIDVIAKLAVQVREWVGGTLLFVDSPEEDVKPIIEAVERSYQVERLSEYAFATFILEQNHIESPPLPDGFTLRQLDSTAPYVNHFNEDQGFLPNKDVKYLFCDYIDHLPSAGIFSEDNQLVGYLLTNDYGSVGKMYVHPDHRRRGFASHLIAHMTNRIVAEGYLNKCLINAYVWNEKSYACFKKMGYKYIENSERAWLVIV